MKYLRIKIVGSGDKHMLIQALDEVLACVKNTPNKKLEEGIQWEDGILLAEISEITEE